MGMLSPAFRELGLESHGLEWAHAKIPLAHPLPDGKAGILQYSIDDTIRELGLDAGAWNDLFAPLLERQSNLFAEILGPIRIPRHPLLMAGFGLNALRSCTAVLRRFKTAEARALFAGCAAHSIVPLDRLGTASFGMILALTGHAVGWPCARGGSFRIIEALAACLRQHGGEIVTKQTVRKLTDVPPARAILFDLAPRHIARIAEGALPGGFRRQLEAFRYGHGVFKVDFALSDPIPWANKTCASAATVHVCGTAEELIASEGALAEGKVSERPFVLVAQQSMFDSSRAPTGKHTGWAYCHVPAGYSQDATGLIERQIERFAPGFRETILARHSTSPADYERYNPNFIGGDIGGGANTLAQFLFRPTRRWNPYTTPNPKLFICSSSTPPGGGVHGMCGYWAAQAALTKLR
jgi:phytoene dehydrogenase-like protein